MRHLLLTTLAGVIAVATAHGGAHAQNQSSSIGYPSVEAARQALASRPGVRTVEQQGWFIVEDPTDLTIWSFTPAKHEAHPAVVKRTVIQKDGKVVVQMNVLCSASKEA